MLLFALGILVTGIITYFKQRSLSDSAIQEQVETLANYGNERMLAALNGNLNATPMQMLGNVRTSVDGFVKSAEQFDDLTMLCLEYKGKDG